MSYVLQKQEREAQPKQKYSSTDNCILPTLINKEQLNTIITNKDGTPDYLAINIYFDTLRSWYNPKMGLLTETSLIRSRVNKIQPIS